ncbi:MAG: EAL domain-containing protein [Salinarimonadaceae bacterium]|nr:MAG: EAL domain-containing protein [Salinarimonadaceae bacterium]
MRGDDVKRVFRERFGVMVTMRTWALAGTASIAFVASSVAAWSLYGATAAAAVVAASTVALAAGAFQRAGRAARVAEKTSSDLDAVARRLLRLESRLAEIARQPFGETRRTVAEVSGEIALLSGLLRDLAATVSGHDRDVATLAEEIVALRDRARAAPPATHAAAQETPVSKPAPATQETSSSAGVAWTSQLADFPPEDVAAPPISTPPVSAPPVSIPPSEPPEALSPEPAAREPAAEPIDPAEETRRRAIIQAFREDRIEIHLQPVVSLPQRKTKFYEALARLRLPDDTLVAPADFLPVLEAAKLAPELDGKVAARAAAVARHLVNRGSDAFVTCNISPASVRTPGFLRALGRIVEAYPDVLGRLAFEISQRCWRTLDAETAGALEQLRKKGAFFILDRATDLRIDALTLADRGVAYVKLPARMLLDPQPSHGLDFEPADIATMLARAGIRLVAEKVEFEHDVPDLIDMDAPLAQGFVFGPPRGVRADIVGGGASPARKTGEGGGRPAAKPRASGQAGAPPARQQGRATAADASPAKREARESNANPPGPTEPPEPRLPYRAFLRRAG